MKLNRDNYSISLQGNTAYIDSFSEIVEEVASAFESGKISQQEAGFILGLALKRQSHIDVREVVKSSLIGGDVVEKQLLFMQLKTKRSYA